MEEKEKEREKERVASRLMKLHTQEEEREFIRRLFDARSVEEFDGIMNKHQLAIHTLENKKWISMMKELDIGVTPVRYRTFLEKLWDTGPILCESGTNRRILRAKESKSWVEDRSYDENRALCNTINTWRKYLKPLVDKIEWARELKFFKWGEASPWSIAFFKMDSRKKRLEMSGISNNLKIPISSKVVWSKYHADLPMFAKEIAILLKSEACMVGGDWKKLSSKLKITERCKYFMREKKDWDIVPEIVDGYYDPGMEKWVEKLLKNEKTSNDWFMEIVNSNRRYDKYV